MGVFEIPKLRVVKGTDYRNGQSRLVFQFERNNIKIQIPDDIKKGNYRIGVIEDDWFIVKYVGRVTDQTLQERLLQHKNHTDAHYYDDSHYFFYSAADSDNDAIKQECIDFHSFGEEEYLDNECHPSLSQGEKCPWSDCDHVGGE